MRDQQFASSRSDEASMSTDTYVIGLMRSVRYSAPRRFDLRKFVGKVMRIAATYVKGFSAGRNAAYLAERYHAMNDAQLARIGLTREQISDKLRRLC